MANHPAAALPLREGDRAELERLARSSSAPAGLARRARIVMMAAAGMSNTEIAQQYGRGGLAGLADGQRPGRPRTIDAAGIIAETLQPPPEGLGVTRWSTRLLGARLRVANSTVAKAWRAYGIRPQPCGAFRFGTDPALQASVVDVVGLYLHPPQHAVVLRVDEECRVQAPVQPALIAQPVQRVQSVRPHPVVRRSHDGLGHGTTTLLGALNAVPAPAGPGRQPWQRHEELLIFLGQVARAHPGGGTSELHLITDSGATLHPAVRDWLAANPRIRVHRAPGHRAWMNMVEVWLTIAGRGAERSGSGRGIRILIAAIRAFTDGWDDRTHPVTWTGTARATPTPARRPAGWNSPG